MGIAVCLLSLAHDHISETFKQAHPEIPWKSIIAQRNVVAHGYGEIKSERIWGVVKTHLVGLADALAPLLPPLPPELDLRESPAPYTARPAVHRRAAKRKKKSSGRRKARN